MSSASADWQQMKFYNGCHFNIIESIIGYLTHMRCRVIVIFISVCVLYGCQTKNDRFSNYIFGSIKIQTSYTLQKDINEDEKIIINMIKNVINISSDYQINLINIKYKSNNLPQYAVHVTNNKNKKILFYNHGHSGLPSAKEDFSIKLLSKLLENDFDLLITSMPLTGINSPIASKDYFILAHGSSSFSKVDHLLFQWPTMHTLYSSIQEQGNFIRFFIDSIVIPASIFRISNSYPNYEVNYTFLNGYRQSYYIGLSGGATLGLTACAIVSFDKCILVAGFLPLRYRLQNSAFSWGDYEQIADSLYRQFPYESIMNLAAASSKKMIYIYNDNDSCCFRNPEAEQFKNDFKNFDIRVRKSDSHSYDPDELIQELLMPNETFPIQK